MFILNQQKNDCLNKSTREKVICASVILVFKKKIYKSNLVYSTQDDMSNEKFFGKEN